MTAFITRRVLSTIPLLLGIVVISFLFMRLAPGGPFDMDQALDPTVRANLEAHYGLDQPIHVQLGMYLKGLVQGDLGPSFKYAGYSVKEILIQGAPVSFALGFAALLISLMIGIPLGTLAALHHNERGDRIATGLAMIGICVPNFVLGPLLILVFVFQFGWLPVGGWGTPAQVVLPAFTLGAIRAAYIARLTRTGMLDVLQQDFVRTARAKGLRERSIVVRHVLRIGLLPTVQYLGPATASIFVGSVVVERIFSVPGLGSFFINAALNRDYTLAMGSVLLYSVMLIALNLIVDLVSRRLDPRVQLT